MEKPAGNKSKNRILKLIPKAAQAAVSFQNLPFSPRRRRDQPDLNRHHNKNFSGPMIPAEARRKFSNFEAQEPTSPKVSCMGQVKRKNKLSKKKHVSLPKGFKPEPFSEPGKTGPVYKTKKKPSGIRGVFGRGRKSGRSSDRGESPPVLETAAAPSLGGLRKFASSRDTFANFDWTAAAQVAPEEDRSENYSDEERGCSDGEDEVIIPFSAPIMMGGCGAAGGLAGLDLEPKKEINLWKRRTMAQPKPLKLNVDSSN